MKKLTAFLLVFCLVLGLASVALAAGPKITKQPESATTDEKGNVSFSLKVSGAKGITWRFVNPETGEEITGKNLKTVFKDIRVNGPNGQTIKLYNVPDEMHGWYVYCHLTANSNVVDSDRVRLLVYGLPDPDTAGAPAESVPEETPPAETQSEPDEVIITEQLPPEEPEIQAVPETPAEPQTHIDENGNLVEGPPEEVKAITIRAKDAVLYPLDTYGRPVEEEAAAELVFENSADVAVRANGEIRYWLVNGIRIDPEESVSSFLLRNVTSDLSVTAVLSGASAQQVDENTLVSVTCEGCKFTWSKGNMKNVTSGEVPAGSEILIMANPAPASGYSLNGGPFEDAGKFSVRRVVTEDTTIKAE